jgi:lipopolysaccharide/colanic/teichoic acid biosynthesis glycosyltransferase
MSRTIPHPSEAVAAALSAADVPYPLAKRVFDRTVAALLLVVLSPLLALAFAILAVDMLFVPRDRGRWLYRERRISRGREFEVLKFRVLREDVLAEIASKEDAYARLYEADHANLTGAGQIVKRIYADELPQIINVLRGEMSLVGPRPERPEFVDLFGSRINRYVDRHRVKSGMTGWAQVHGFRGQTSLHDRVEWDNYYIENFSLWLDLKIVGWTVRSMFSRSAQPS